MSKSKSKEKQGSTEHWWQKTREIRWVTFILMILTIVVLFLILWTVMNHESFSLHAPDSNATTFVEQLPSIASLSQGALIEGNAVEIGFDGVFFDRLLEDIASAEETIHLETFVWWTGEITERLADALAERAREGVEVRVLVDASGGADMTDEVRDRLGDFGIELQFFRPFRLGNLGRLNYRTHRKIAVIDGRIAYLFGHGIAQQWTGSAQDKSHYRDAFARIRGPIVNQIQGVFFENWVEEKRTLPTGTKYFPPQPEIGDVTAHLAWIQPVGDVSSVETLYHGAIAAAREELLIQNPYFIVEDEGLELFRRAISRGVRVRVMLPSVESTDNAIVQHASHWHFEELLEMGVEIYEYEKTLLHNKTMVIDSVWASIGSTNFDDRSFELNDEIQIGFVSEELAATLIEQFNKDLEHATQMDLEEFRNRGIVHKARDLGAYLFNEQL